MAKSKTEKLIGLLSTGKQYTADQIVAKTGVANPSANIFKLREQGFTIYTNPSRDNEGYRVYKYRMSA